MLPLRARVELGAMAMKWFSAFPKVQHPWNFTIRLFSAISRTLVGSGGLTPLQSSNRCILHSQLTRQLLYGVIVHFRVISRFQIYLFENYTYLIKLITMLCYITKHYYEVLKTIYIFNEHVSNDI